MCNENQGCLINLCSVVIYPLTNGLVCTHSIHQKLSTMKKQINIGIAVTGLLFAAALILNPVSAMKRDTPGKPLADDVMKITVKICEHCHSEPGNPIALMHLNFSNWDKYSAEKQAAKAKAMCSMVTKDKMPPKSFRKTHPDEVQSQADNNKICNWAASIQIVK